MESLKAFKNRRRDLQNFTHVFIYIFPLQKVLLNYLQSLN